MFVHYTAPSDYVQLSEELTFTSLETRCVAINISNDGILEDNEVFTLALSSMDGSVVLPVQSAPVTILNDDTVFVALATDTYSVNEGMQLATVCAQLTGQAEIDVSVSLTPMEIVASASGE